MTVTPATPWRSTGPCPPDDWHRVLRALSAWDRDQAYDVAGDLSLLCLGQMGPESAYATSDLYDETGNMLGLRPRPNDPRPVYQHPTAGPFLVFGSPAECVTEWRSRILDPTYKGGIYTPGTTTILEYVSVYAPASDGNNPAAYAARICADMNRWLGTEGTPMPDLVFGRVPAPPVAVRDILAPGVRANGDGWNAMGRDRRNFGVVYHRTVGRSIAGTGDWFRRPGTGLTHYGVGAPAPDAGPDGAISQWVDPRARVSPWASGPWENPPGDGRALVAKYGVEAINGDLIAIEISGLYDDPIGVKTVAAVAAISAYWADQARVPHHQYPTNPATGLTFTYWHSEFQAHKPCPGDVVRRETADVIEETRAILRRAQEAGAPAPTPPPSSDLDYPPGWDAAIASAVWGDKYPAYRYNEEGAISGIWLNERACSPLVHHFKDAVDGRESFTFGAGVVIGRLNANEPYRVLSKPR